MVLRRFETTLSFWFENKLEGITSLFLAINRVGDEGAKDIACGVRQYKALQRLDLASNRIQVTGLTYVLAVASVLPKLIFLDLGLYKSTSDMKELPNYFGDDGAIQIADFIKRNKTVQILSIQDSNVGPKGLQLIVDAVQENDVLRFVYAGQYGYCTPKPLLAQLWAKLDQNCLKHENVDVLTYRKDKLRYVKHTDRVKDIDSIYRNNM